MSRHEYDGNGARLAIGWDAPLATYYLQVWVDAFMHDEMDEDERETPQVWLGVSYGEAPDPHPLVAIARRHVPTIPDDLVQTLLIEELAKPARPLAAGTNTLHRLLNTLAGEPPIQKTRH